MNDKELDRNEAAWEAWLAEGWRSAETGDAGTAGESLAFARKLDGILRRERAERRAWSTRWMRWGAAAACAAALAVASWWGLAGGGAGGDAVDTAEAAGEPVATTLAEAREAPVEEEFAGLEEMLTLLASADIGYEWADETWAD